MRYNVYTGVEQAKLNLKRYVFGAGAAIALAIGFSVPAFAAGIPANFPGNNGTSCNAWHGAPGGLGVNSPYYWVQSEGSDGNTLPNGSTAPSGGANFGAEQGVVTGQNNSGLAASCNQ